MKKIVPALLLCSVLVLVFMVSSVHAQGLTIQLMNPIGNRNIFYGGAVIDVKFKLFDDGVLVTNAVATLTVDGAAATGRGQFNSGNFFTIQNQNYVFKLETRQLDAGFGSSPHTLKITVTVGGETITESTTISLH